MNVLMWCVVPTCLYEVAKRKYKLGRGITLKKLQSSLATERFIIYVITIDSPSEMIKFLNFFI